MVGQTPKCFENTREREDQKVAKDAKIFESKVYALRFSIKAF